MTNVLTHSGSLYLTTVIIWGTTFYAIKFQLGVVEAEISLVYRFLGAAVILLLFCLLTKRNLRFSPVQHLFIFLQGLFLFSVNYVIIYWATELLTSGIIALLFSTVILINIINGAVFLRQLVTRQVVIGAMIGIAGIAAVFWSEVAGLDYSQSSWLGLWLCLLATFSASLGNILSAHNQRIGLPVIQTNAWGMTYGTLVLTAYALYRGSTFNYDFSVGYSISLFYLSIFGSVIAFGSYLTLVGRIGAGKAAYTAVLFPVVALSISTVFENYQWTFVALCGFGLVLIGNYLVLRTPPEAPVPHRTN